MSDKLHTHLYAAGAEFLVIGQLLVIGIECYKAYTNYPGYDLVAVCPDQNKSARIQVKSRWATNRAGHFSIKNLDCDFVVHVSLNRGIRKRKETIDETTQEPDFYVFPASIIKKHRSPTDKINLNNIHDYNQYKNRWDLIEKMLVS